MRSRRGSGIPDRSAEQRGETSWSWAVRVWAGKISLHSDHPRAQIWKSSGRTPVRREVDYGGEIVPVSGPAIGGYGITSRDRVWRSTGIHDDAGKNGLNLILAHHGLTMNILLFSHQGFMVIWRNIAIIPGKKS